LAGWALVLFLAWPARAQAATTVSGEVGNQTWTAAGSPYQTDGPVTVPAGQTLTIEAGTCVLVGDQGQPGSAPRIDVLGTLVVNGTRAAPVTFDSVSGLAKSWGGIAVWGGAYIRGAIVHHGRSGIFDYGGVLNVRDSLFEDTGFAAIERRSGVATVDAIVSRHNENGVFSWNGSGTLTLTNSLIVGNTLNGVGLDNSPPSTIVNCTIVGSTYGVYVYGSGGGVVRNSIITSNRFGVQKQGPSSTSGADLSIVNSDVFGNNTNFDQAVPGQGCISAAPLFVGPDDYHLAAGSPCIDTGATPDPNDHDLDGVSRPVGVALDMGAYEWTAAGSAGGTGAGGAPACHGAGGEGGQAADAGGAAGTDGAAGSGAGGGAGSGFDAGPVGGDAGAADGGGGGGSGGATGAPDAGDSGAAGSGVDASADARGPRVARHGCGCGLAPGDGGGGLGTVALFALAAAAARGRRRPRRHDLR